MKKIIALLLFPLFSIAGEQPNIVFILSDDVSTMDIAAYAARIKGVDRSGIFYETPNINKLVDEGTAFSQFYVHQLCSPTRASVITGINAAKTGITTAVGGGTHSYYIKGQTPPKGYHKQDVLEHTDHLKEEQALINGITRIALPSGKKGDLGGDRITLPEMLEGYESAFIGKWHLGGHGAEGFQPTDQGFDRAIAYADAGGSQYFNWREGWADKELPYPKMDQKEWLFGEAGEETGEEYLTDDLTVQAVNYLKEKANDPSKPFMLYFCHFAVHLPVQGKEEYIEYFKKKNETTGSQDNFDPTYAAMLKSLDESVGAILDQLKESGLDKNTLVVFMSDNGGVNWRAGGTVATNSAPLKGGKATLFEGGVRVPLIMKLPGKIKSGVWSNVPVHCTDVLPTLCELTGNEVKNEIDGESIVPLFNDLENKNKAYKHNTFYWHYPFNVVVKNPMDGNRLTPHSAIRKGDYKLIFDWHGRLLLYNIKEDMFETTDLSKEKPELTKELFKDLIDWTDESVAPRYWPTLNPDYNAANDQRAYPFKDLRKEMLGHKGF